MHEIFAQTQSQVCEVDPNKYWELIFYGFRFLFINGVLWIITQAFFRM